MKKFLSYLLVLIVLGSCGEDISVNNNGVFQGIKDNNIWVGGNAAAITEVGNKMTIRAATLTEEMALKFPKPSTIVNPANENTFIRHDLGTSLNRKAVYVVTTGSEVFTYETAIGVGDGEILIKEYDGNVISGTFRFNAVNTDPESTAQGIVNLQSGVFYRVPVR